MNCSLRFLLTVCLIANCIPSSFAKEAANGRREFLKLKHISEVFDGGSVRFDFETKRGPLKIILTDQTVLKENQMENPEKQRISLVDGNETIFLKPGSMAERDIIRDLINFSKVTVNDETIHLKIEKLIMIIRERNTPLVQRDFWYK